MAFGGGRAGWFRERITRYIIAREQCENQSLAGIVLLEYKCKCYR